MTDENQSSSADRLQTPRPRNWVRRVRHGAHTVWWLAMLPVVFALIAGISLIDREVTAPSWVVQAFERQAERSLGGGDLSFDDIKLIIGRDLHPRVRLQEVTLTDAGGARVAHIREVRGLLSPRGVVLERRALLQDVTIIGTRVDLTRDLEGQFELSLGQGSAAVAQAPSLVDVLDQLDTIFAEPALEALETISSRELTIQFDDRKLDQSWAAEGETLSLDLRGATRRLDVAMRLIADEEASPARAALSFVSVKETGEADVSFRLENMQARDIALQSAALTPLSIVDAPVSVSVSAPISGDGNLGLVALDLDIGTGVIASDQAPIPFTDARVAMGYDAEAAQATIDALEVNSPLLSFTSQGQILGKSFSDGLPEYLYLQLQAQDIGIDAPDTLESALAFAGATFDARLHLNPLHLEIGQLTVTDPGFPLQASGEVASQSEGWEIMVDFVVPKVDLEMIKSLWPVTSFPGVRRWFVGSLLKGTVRNATGAVRLRPGNEPVWAVGYNFEDVEQRIMRDMPHIKGGAGYASFENNAFALSVYDGYMASREGGRIDLAGSTVRVPEMLVRFSPLYLDVVGNGTITSILSALDDSPVRLMQKINKPVAMADGRANVTGQISFPRLNPVPPDQITYDMDAVLTRVSSTEAIPERQLLSSRIKVDVDNEGVTLSGPARVDGVPVEAKYRRDLADPTARVTADVEVSEEALAAFDIALPPGTVAGRGRGALTISLPPGERPEFQITSDLRGLQIVVPPVGWSKPTATEGNLFVEGRLGDRPEITRFEVSGGGLSTRGRLEMQEGGSFGNASFSQLRIGDWFDASLSLRSTGAATPPAVTINGGQIDLRRARFGSGQSETGPVEISLDRLQITEGIALANFRGSFTGAGGFNGRFSGNLNDGPQVIGTVVPSNGRSAVRLQSEDAGGLARAAGLLQGGAGGTVDLTLLPASGEGNFDGTLVVRGLRVRDAPTMAALLDAISVVGLLQQLDGQGLAFDEVDAKFRLAPDRLIVTEASAVGPGLGISLDGIYTLASKQLDFQGVISPLYILNGIGSFLTRRGEGLIGFNYAVTGTSDAPEVSVNPLSALTPGMFREIFRKPVPEVAE